MSTKALWVLKKGQVENALKNNERLDQRKLDEYRAIEIETGVFHHAEGSARVKLGKTEVVAGVKMEVEKPYPDSPNKGSISVNLELTPMASPDFESGPPSESAIELARVVDRGIRESGMVDLEKLCIEPGEKAWTVFSDVVVVNHDGNLFDASTIAVIAALMTAKMPKYDAETSKILRGEWADPLPITQMSTLSTFAKIGDKIVLDTGLEEDHSLDARVSVSVNEDGNITALQKGGLGAFTFEELERIISKDAVTASKHLQKTIKEQVRV